MRERESRWRLFPLVAVVTVAAAATAVAARAQGNSAPNEGATPEPTATPTPLIRLMPEPRPTRPPLPSATPTVAPDSGAAKETALPPPRRRPAVLELTLVWPVQFIQTSNAQGSATSYSLLGYGADGALCLGRTACVLAGVGSNLNPRTGGRLLTGVSLGAQGFFVGQPDPPPESEKEARAVRLPRLQSIWRIFGSVSFCQKDYDFRSLYGDDSDQVFVGARPELEGSFWCASGTAGFDYLFRSGHRLGLGVSVFRSLSGSQSELAVNGYSVDLRYQILRF